MNTAHLKTLIKIAKQHVIRPKDTPYALRDIAFVFRRGELKLEASDFDVGFRSNTILTASGPDATWLVPVSKLTEIMKQEKGEQITLNVHDGRMWLGAHTFTNNQAREWPILFNEYDANKCQHSLSQEILQKLSPAMSKDETRSALQVVYLDRGNHKAATTDGHRLHVADILYDGESMSIPNKMARILADCEQIKISNIIGRTSWAKTEHGEHFFKTEDGKFPNYTQFIPTEFDCFIEDDRLELINKLEVLRTFTDSKRGIVFKDGTIAVYPLVKNGQLEMTTLNKLQIVKYQKGAPLYYNIDFLLDALKNIDCKTVTIKYKEDKDGKVYTPTVIKSNNMLVVIMPMRGPN